MVSNSNYTYFQDVFTLNAEKYQPHSWFYAMSHELVKNDIKLPNETSIFVYKEEDVFFFDGNISYLFYILEYDLFVTCLVVDYIFKSC